MKLKLDLRDLWYRATGSLAAVPLSWHDSRRNRRFATAQERFLIVRHPRKSPHFYDVLLSWLEANHPAVRSRFELHLLGGRIRQRSYYVLHVPWLQDPVQAWSPTAYQQADRLARDCDALGIPIINRVDRLANAGKVNGAALIGATGIRTPRMARVVDLEVFRETRYGLELPLFVREDWRHSGPIFRVDSPAELRQLPVRRFRRPVAVEIIDVQDPRDGLYRKYRYLAAGEFGLPLSMHPCRSWFAKGTRTEFNAALRDEELAFLSQPDPNHERLQAARRALGLDFVAFDYSYDRQGRLVVWEANPFPYIHFGTVHRQYRWPAVERALAAMARLYLTRAELPVPVALASHLQFARGAQGCAA